MDVSDAGETSLVSNVLFSSHSTFLKSTVFQGPAHICMCQIVIREVLMLEFKEGRGALCHRCQSVCVLPLLCKHLQNVKVKSRHAKLDLPS